MAAMESELRSLKNQLAKTSGPEGILALRAVIQNGLQEKKNERCRLDGDIRTHQQILNMLDRLSSVYADKIPDGAIDKAAESLEENQQPVEKNPMDLELERRTKEGLCCYRGKDKKWCQRSLKTKAEKNARYCKIHANELGIELPVTRKKRTTKRSKKE